MENEKFGIAIGFLLLEHKTQGRSVCYWYLEGLKR